MTLSYWTDLEDARIRLSEGFLRLWEQADLIDDLFRQGKSTERAKDALHAMQQTVSEMQMHISVLVREGERAAG